MTCKNTFTFVFEIYKKKVVAKYFTWKVPSVVSWKECFGSWWAVKNSTLWPLDFNASPASKTARSAPPIPRSGCRNATFTIINNSKMWIFPKSWWNKCQKCRKCHIEEVYWFSVKRVLIGPDEPNCLHGEDEQITAWHCKLDWKMLAIIMPVHI